jgi:hypothetical protein
MFTKSLTKSYIYVNEEKPEKYERDMQRENQETMHTYNSRLVVEKLNSKK